MILTNVTSYLDKLSAKDQVSILSHGYSSNNLISLSQDIIKLVINCHLKSGCFDRRLIAFNH